MHKCYSILYTCATTRGVVLDVVTDPHADTLLLSLTRHISCFGCPKKVLTDNGPAFASSKVQLFAAQRNIKWIFTPEEAPWFLGFWERLVRSVKRCIKKITGRTCLTFTEMQTLFFEIEQILNSRPLTTLFEDDNEQTLTPNHLFYRRQLAYTKADNENMTECNQKFTKHINHIKLMLEHFWSRWKKDYYHYKHT